MWIEVKDSDKSVARDDLATKPAAREGYTAYQKPKDATLIWRPMLGGFARAETPASVEADLIGQVKGEAERLRMMALTRGAGKAAEYRLKHPEAEASRNLLAAVLDALTKLDRTKQYPTAATEAALTGEKLSVVLKRYRDAMDATDAEVRRVSAIEQTGVRAIRAATTVTAKRAAFAAIAWGWQPA